MLSDGKTLSSERPGQQPYYTLQQRRQLLVFSGTGLPLLVQGLGMIEGLVPSGFDLSIGMLGRTQGKEQHARFTSYEKIHSKSPHRSSIRSITRSSHGRCFPFSIAAAMLLNSSYSRLQYGLRVSSKRRRASATGSPFLSAYETA